MKLVIVTSIPADNQVQRITTDSSLQEVVALLRSLEVTNWELYSKGQVRLEASSSELYVAIGPEKNAHKKHFLAAAETVLQRRTVAKLNY